MVQVIYDPLYSPAMGTAAELLREARRRAGLSQVELGRRSGVAQSVVSAYESGARQPSVPMLVRLVNATGSELDIRLAGTSGPETKSGFLGQRIRRHRGEMLKEQTGKT